MPYQGRLAAGGQPAQGIYDLRFTIYAAVESGTQVGMTFTNNATSVTNGLFTATLDFGEGVFTSEARWLEIGVRTNGSGAFTNLSPRQLLTPAPYALYAPSAGAALTAASANGVAATNITGIMALAQLPGAVLTNNASGVSLSGTLIGNATTATSAATANNFSGLLAGDVTGTQGVTVVSLVGGQSAANVASGVGAANAATSTNTPDTIVKRDASGNFSAGTITTTGDLLVGGQITGRLLNAKPNPVSASSNNMGQLFYNTSDKKLYYSTGDTWQPVESTRTYRWNVWSTYDLYGSWLCNNDATLFGGVTPQYWSYGSYNTTAQQISSNKALQSGLFNKKAVVSPNSLVWAEITAHYPQPYDTFLVGALFRIRNTTSSSINWTVYFYATYYGNWGEWASVALNGVNVWTSSGGNSNPGGSAINATMTLPAGRVSTVIFIATSGYPTSTSYAYFRPTVLAFYNNSLTLPAGLEFVDDLDTASGGYEQ